MTAIISNIDPILSEMGVEELGIRWDNAGITLYIELPLKTLRFQTISYIIFSLITNRR